MEGRRPHALFYPSTILRMVPLPIRCANREETRTATHPPIVSISRASNLLTPRIFQKTQRHQPSWPGPAPIIVPVPSQGRLARPAIRSGGGSGWSGISLCKQMRPDRDRGPPKGSPAGVEDRGGYPGRSRDRDVARPARRRRCGKARTRPPDASFRKTVCAERSVFVETVFLSAHPGEGPGAPPRLPLDLPRLRGGARPLACAIPGKPARKGKAEPGRQPSKDDCSQPSNPL